MKPACVFLDSKGRNTLVLCVERHSCPDEETDLALMDRLIERISVFLRFVFHGSLLYFVVICFWPETGSGLCGHR
jgi:hypothetical protein